MGGTYDVIVVGIGGMGSAAAYHLASREVDTLGLERFDVPHDRGSSHGITRIIRKGQYEDPEYVPLAERSYDLWRELEAVSGRELLHITGGVDAGPPDGDVFPSSRDSCREHDIDYEVLTGREVNERFPGYDLPADHRAVYQPESGFLVPEQCLIAHVEAAQERGAEIHAREAVTDVSTDGDAGVRVTTDRDTYAADDVVVTAGAWAGEFLPGLADELVPVRQILAWLQPSDPELFDPTRFPVFIHETETEHYYGFPRFDVPGFKFARFNHFRETVDPDGMDREPTKRDEEMLRSYARRYFPEGAGPTMRLSTCMFTNTPDGHFVLDAAPGRPRVTVGAGFSGHGFKFASVVGEILADLALDGETDHDIDLFAAGRFDADRGE
jgi:sarcosine oxidase